MYEIIIELDEHKIMKEGKYQLAEMKSTLSLMAGRAELICEGEFIFKGKVESANGFIMALLNTPWFMNNVRKWEYWNRDKNYFEDVIETCKRKGVM